MNIMQELEKSLKSDAPAYLEFLHRYHPKKRQVFAFYEGDEDSSFYRQYIEEIVGTDCLIEEIVAGCKRNVLKLHHEFDWTIYNYNQFGFFVDRDLSYWLNQPTINDSNIFVTDGYSVENYMIERSIFYCLIKQIKGFARSTGDEINNMIDTFEHLLPVFENAIMPIMAMAVIAKKRNPDIVLSDYPLASLLSFNLVDKGVIILLKECSGIKEKWGITDITREEIEDLMEAFTNNKKHFSIRGKWVLYFMVELSEYMRKNHEFFARSISVERLRATCHIDSSNSLSMLAPRFRNWFPSSLRIFLSNLYPMYLNSHVDAIAN